MTNVRAILVGEMFKPTSGRPKYIRDFMDRHLGDYPVYSASLTKPFGFVDAFDFEGHYLTWVMNGYGGRVQEVSGKFSATRDRGVFVPHPGVKIPDLTYLRFAMEPQLKAAAVGRRVDGRQNEYTKIYPETAGDVLIELPATEAGDLDFEKMTQLGQRLRKIEAAQADVKRAVEPLERAAFSLNMQDPSRTISLSDDAIFALSIGERVLTSQHVEDGVPTYSANPLKPFCKIKSSNLSDFSRPSLLWGIDGNFDWNLVGEDVVFANTDHCGRLQILNENIDPEYIYWYLKLTVDRYAFDRVYRANLENIRADVSIAVPLSPDGTDFSLERQLHLAKVMREREQSRAGALALLNEVLQVRLATVL